MRQLVLHGPRRVAVEEGEPKPLEPDEVLVAVDSVGVCGSDVHGYAGANARRAPRTVMGHEAAGIVVERGEAVEGLEPGTPVAINPVVGCDACPWCLGGEENLCERRMIYGCVRDLPGAYAEYLVLKAANAVPFAGRAPLEWGALVEPLAVGARAARLGEVDPGAEALVVGGGPIGLAAALACRRRGAARVVVSEPLARRREVAERLGFETIDPADVRRSAFPLAFECVGHSTTLAASLNALAPKGMVVFVGLAEETIALPATLVMVGERVIRGSSAYSASEFRETAAWVAATEVDLAPLVENRVGLDELPGVFEGYATGSLHAVKTLLRFPEENSWHR